MVEVSVVTPTYNRADVINRAINSALAQTLRDIEVIVVDDGSTDETQEVVTRISDPRVTYLKHDKNRGGSAARNTGIDHAEGKYIAFLDSDDEWKPSKLKRQHNELKSRSSEWVGVYCDFRQLRSNRLIELIDNRMRRPTGFEGDDELIDRIFLRKFAHGGASTLFVEANAVNKIDGFDPAFQRHQDVEFLIRLLQIGKLAYVDEPLVLKHDTGHPSAEVVLEAMEQFNEKFMELIEERGYKHRVRRIQRFMLAKIQFSKGRFNQGIQTIQGSSCPHFRDMLGLGVAVGRGIRQVINGTGSQET